jgi:ABC-2 type transport system permease protein
MADDILFFKMIKLYRLYAKMDLSWFLRDTRFCITVILADLVSNFTAVTGIFLLAWSFDGISGMSKYEVLFMLGYITLIKGAIVIFFANCNTGHISRRIGRGQLDHMMIQPLPMPVQLLTEGFVPVSGNSNFISGIIIIVTAVMKLGIDIKWWWILSVIGNVFFTVSIIIFLSYLFSSLAFYAPVEAEEISSYVMDSLERLNIFPLSGMPKYFKIILITVFPAGLIGWFPTMSLLGKPPLNLPVIFPALVAGILFILAVIFFRKGLMHYVKIGSNRYSSLGHRS